MRWNGVAIHALRLFREPLDKTGAEEDFASRFRKRFALLERQQLCQLGVTRNDQVVPATQDSSALLRCLLRPCWKRRLRSHDRCMSLRRGHIGDGRDVRTVGGIQNIKMRYHPPSRNEYTNFFE